MFGTSFRSSVPSLLTAGAFLLAVSTGSAADLAKEVEQAVATHEATLASIKTLHLKVTQRYKIHGDEMQTYDETEWWHVGDRDRFADVHLRDTDTGARIDPALREESSFDGKEARSIDLWNSDDKRKAPLIPRGEDAYMFARARGLIMPAASGMRHGLYIQLMFAPNGESLRSYVEEADEAKVVSSDENAVTLELRFPTYLAILELDPKQGHLVRRGEYRHGTTAEETTVVQVAFAEKSAVPFPLRVVTSQGDKVALEITISDLAINEPLEPERATVRFPEGGQVERFDGQKTVTWYVWGKDEPRLTFDSLAEFNEWLRGAMQGAQEE